MNFKNDFKFRKGGKTMRFARSLSEILKSCFSTFQPFTFSTIAFAVVAAMAATAANAAATTAGTEDEPQRVVFRFGNSEKQSSDTITSQRGVRRWLDDGRRIIFMLADSCHEAESLLRAVPESVDGTDDSDGPFFQLVLDSGEKVTRLSYDDLARYIPNYSDSESFTDLSPESDIDLGRGWRLTRIEIVPTVVPGLETVQGWTARLELSQKETGASDRLQLSSDWHERDIQGAASGIVGSLFGTIPGQAEEKILGREWDKNLT